LTIALCHVRKLKTGNRAIETGNNRKLKTYTLGDTRNRKMVRGVTSRSPNRRRKGVQIIAGRLFLSRSELKQAAE